MRCTGYEIQGLTGQPSVREIDAHTIYYINEQPLLAEASTILD